MLDDLFILNRPTHTGEIVCCTAYAIHTTLFWSVLLTLNFHEVSLARNVLFTCRPFQQQCFLLTRPAWNKIVNKISVERVRYYYSCIRITIVGSQNVSCNQLWRHQQIINRAGETLSRYVKIAFIVISLLCRVRNKIMYVRPWRAHYVFSSVIWYSFPKQHSCEHKQKTTSAHTIFYSWRVLCKLSK